MQIKDKQTWFGSTAKRNKHPSIFFAQIQVDGQLLKLLGLMQLRHICPCHLVFTSLKVKSKIFTITWRPSTISWSLQPIASLSSLLRFSHHLFHSKFCFVCFQTWQIPCLLLIFYEWKFLSVDSYLSQWFTFIILLKYPQSGALPYYITKSFNSPSKLSQFLFSADFPP